MPTLEFKVAHSIPGRIRLRIPKLRQDVDFSTRLQALVGVLEPVTEVKLDRPAASLVVHYRKDRLSPVQLQGQLVVAINQAADPAVPTQMEVELPGYTLRGLTPYEYLQVQEIVQWRHNTPSVFANVSGEILAPIQKVVNALVPDGFLEKVIPLLETATENWHQEWAALYQQALADFIEASVEGEIQGVAVEAILKRVLRNILKLESAEVIPVIGVVMGIVGARAMIEEVSAAARHAFQMRWLLENQQTKFAS